MTRLSELPRHIYLDLIEEARFQNDAAFVDDCIRIDATINELCNWARTRQGYDYWSYINSGLFLKQYQLN